ncbi:MAG: hypothetical protein ACLVB1_04915 [Blautia obeum]
MYSALKVNGKNCMSLQERARLWNVNRPVCFYEIENLEINFRWCVFV